MQRIGIATSLSLLAAGCAAEQSPSGPNYEYRSSIPVQIEDAYYQRADEAVRSRLTESFAPQAKNVILFVGDGMGVSTVTAMRIYAGQSQGLDGESYKLSMEQLPNAAFSRTYSHDYQVPDSAATATAMVSGIKTRSGTLGVTADVARGNCGTQAGNTADSLFEMAERNGLATGVISTARLTHATPASTYAKSVSRDWEDDMSFDAGGTGDCPDIAKQLIDWPVGDGFEIAMGGGRRHFLTDETFDPEYTDTRGRRGDERDLVSEWAAKSDQHEVIYDGAAFEATDFASDIRVLGLFEPSHMQYELDRPADEAGEPSIAEMTEAAITRLSRDQDGYLLMVESGRIDHAHHGVNAVRAMVDGVAFDDAIAKAVEMTDPAETLIIVTADHSHTMTMAGYPRRNNPILGKVTFETGAIARAADGKPYTTIGYINGPTACQADDETLDCTRQDISSIDTTAADYRQQAAIFMPSETHSGEDVPIFASGPGSELVRGVMDQNEIFHVMGYASGLVELPATE